MQVARFDFSYGKLKENVKLVKKFFEARRLRPDKMCALMLELKGRQIRTCYTENGQSLFFKEKETTVIRYDGERSPSSQKIISIDSSSLANLVTTNEKIVFEGGKLIAVVRDVLLDEIKIEFLTSGELISGASLKLEGKRYEFMNLLRDEDKEALEQVAAHFNFDYVSLPFATSAKDIQQVRILLKKLNPKIAVCARIDTIECVHVYESMLKIVDAVIIHREELSSDLPADKLVIAQKYLIQKAIEESVPVFLQSQLLDTMINSEVPSRQEVQDISNSVLDGVDGFILNKETAEGVSPLNATATLIRAIGEAENVFNHDLAYQEMRDLIIQKGKKANVTDILCSTAMNIALENNVDLFLCITETGRIARFIAKQRPMQAIFACSVHSNVVKQCNSMRGVIGYKVPAFMKKHTNKLLDLVLKVCKE